LADFPTLILQVVGLDSVISLNIFIFNTYRSQLSHHDSVTFCDSVWCTFAFKVLYLSGKMAVLVHDEGQQRQSNKEHMNKSKKTLEADKKGHYLESVFK
jgi:hypothetical protein